MTHFLRRQTFLVQGLAATVVFSATVAHAQEAESASPARLQLTVRLYGTAQVSPRILDAALATAARALSGAVDVSWRDGDGADVRRPGELVIHLVRSSGPMRPSRFAFGEAVIDVNTSSGVYAAIYVARVKTMADLTKSEVAVLLGRVIAHELGHLLLKTNDHSANGLMRAHWTPESVRRNRPGDWLLTNDDVEAIQKRRR